MATFDATERLGCYSRSTEIRTLPAVADAGTVSTLDELVDQNVADNALSRTPRLHIERAREGAVRNERVREIDRRRPSRQSEGGAVFKLCECNPARRAGTRNGPPAKVRGMRYCVSVAPRAVPA
jgi:hypothetical protein